MVCMNPFKFDLVVKYLNYDWVVQEVRAVFVKNIFGFVTHLNSVFHSECRLWWPNNWKSEWWKYKCWKKKNTFCFRTKDFNILLYSHFFSKVFLTKTLFFFVLIQLKFLSKTTFAGFLYMFLSLTEIYMTKTKFFVKQK